MNNTKVAVVWTDKKPSEYYFNPNWATRMVKYFPKNFEFAFFALSDSNSAIYKEKENYNIWFKPDIKTLHYAVNVFFESDVLIVIGSSNFKFETILGKQKKKIYIHKGIEYKDNINELFDNIIVETKEDATHFTNCVVQPVVDDETFFDMNIFKFFTACYPQEISSENIDFFSSVRLFGSISNNLSTTVTLPLFKTELLKIIMNQSKIVSLFDDNDSFELALSALACNVPVITLEDTKASQIPAVTSSKKDAQEYIKKTLKAMDLTYNYREDYILPNFTVKNMANVIKKLI